MSRNLIRPALHLLWKRLNASPYADCAVDHESIKAHFTNEYPEQQLVVAKQHDACFSVQVSDDQMQAIGNLTTAQGGKSVTIEDAKKEIVKARCQ